MMYIGSMKTLRGLESETLKMGFSIPAMWFREAT